MMPYIICKQIYRFDGRSYATYYYWQSQDGQSHGTYATSMYATRFDRETAQAICDEHNDALGRAGNQSIVYSIVNA